MKRMGLLRCLVLVVFVGLIFSGCDLFRAKITIDQRFASFASHLSNDRGNIYTDFAIGSTGYIAGASGVVFNQFPAGTYTIDNISSGGSTATATLHGPINVGGSCTLNVTFTTNLLGDVVFQTIDVGGIFTI